MTWHHELVATGPIDRVGLLDSTWQDEPAWGDDEWVAMDAPDLVFEGPPYPGLLVRVGVHEGESLRVALSDSVPDWVTLQVTASELIVGDHGFYLSIGNDGQKVDLESGNYSVEVWVDPVAPGQARAVAFIVGPRQPRRLPDRHR